MMSCPVMPETSMGSVAGFQVLPPSVEYSMLPVVLMVSFICIQDHAGSRVLFGDVDSRLLAGQLSTGGRLTNDDVLTAHVRDIERIRAGLPGLTAVITVLQIFGGRDDAGIGIQSHLRSRLFLGNGHSHFAAGRFVVLSGIADDDILAVQVRHIQGFSRRGSRSHRRRWNTPYPRWC